MTDKLGTHRVDALIQIHGQPLDDSPRPVTRVDNMLIWPGGYCRKITWRERLRMRFRPPLVVQPPDPAVEDFQRRFAEYQHRVFLLGEKFGNKD